MKSIHSTHIYWAVCQPPIPRTSSGERELAQGQSQPDNLVQQSISQLQAHKLMTNIQAGNCNAAVRIELLVSWGR